MAGERRRQRPGNQTHAAAPVTRRASGRDARHSLAEEGFRGPMGTVRAVDTYVPLAAAANLVLISDQQIADAAAALFE